ncbi:MAG TPA: lysophospholipase [Steroidobacteraceae bacterium]|nr:lysophospholipase [Steroidobacteraceae bacterium]
MTLRARRWLPSTDARAVVVVAHGLAEHSGRYEALATRLLEQGLATYAIDHRGHGRSGGARANIGRFGHVVEDFRGFVGRAAGEHPGVPLFVLGHSMGGAIAFASMPGLAGSLRGLVLSAPALGVSPGQHVLRSALVRLLSVIAPGFGALQLPAAAVSRDPAVVQAYEADPLVFRGAVPARTIAELLGAMAGFRALAGEIHLPVLIQHGTADTLVPLDAAAPIYNAIASSDCTVELYEGLFHEVYNEPERERVIADLLAWLEGHLAA